MITVCHNYDSKAKNVILVALTDQKKVIEKELNSQLKRMKSLNLLVYYCSLKIYQIIEGVQIAKSLTFNGITRILLKSDG